MLETIHIEYHIAGQTCLKTLEATLEDCISGVSDLIRNQNEDFLDGICSDDLQLWWITPNETALPYPTTALRDMFPTGDTSAGYIWVHVPLWFFARNGK